MTPLNVSWQISAHVRRIEAVEKDLKALADNTSSKDDLSRLRAEVKKIYDGLHVGELSMFPLLGPSAHFESRTS